MEVLRPYEYEVRPYSISNAQRLSELGQSMLYSRGTSDYEQQKYPDLYETASTDIPLSSHTSSSELL